MSVRLELLFLMGVELFVRPEGLPGLWHPTVTQLDSQWAGGQYNSTQVGDKCCICEWPALNTRLLQCGFNPCDWFVPSISQLNNPGYLCRSNWDTFASTSYWSSTEFNATQCLHPVLRQWQHRQRQ
jgi:hypothetical protein